MASKRPTLKTISELSGFAVPTVSRALKDAPDIGESTKRKVREIAAEIGYVPNRAGVRLRTGKTNVISLVLSTDHDMLDDHTNRLISSVSQRLRGSSYHMIVTPYITGEDWMDPIRYIVETNSADAIITTQIEPEDARIAYMMERDFPFATYGRTRWCDEHAYFDFDNTTFGEMAARRLVDAGRRHILLIAPPMRQSYARHIVTGLRSTLDGSSVTMEILDGASSHDGNAVLRPKLLARLLAEPSVDAIVAPSTASAISAVAALERAGRVVGQDIDVFAKEAAPFLQFFRPQILTVREDVVAAGSFLADAAVQAIEHPERKPMQALVAAKPAPAIEALF